jgi:mitochondrial fission 1 protein
MSSQFLMLDDCIDEAELAKHREKFETSSSPSENEKFQFGLNLIRSREKNHITEGLNLFQNLFAKTHDEDIKRDSLYYMAIGQAKLGNYEQSLKYLQTILNIQPTNDQVREMYTEVNKRMKRDGLIGMGIVGSAALVGFFGLVGLGTAMLVKKK